MNVFPLLLDLDRRIRAGETTLVEAVDELRVARVVTVHLTPAQLANATRENDEPQPEPPKRRGRPARS